MSDHASSPEILHLPAKVYLRRGEVVRWLDGLGLSGRYVLEEWIAAGLLKPVVPGQPGAKIGNGPGEKRGHFRRAEVMRLLER